MSEDALAAAAREIVRRRRRVARQRALLVGVSGIDGSGKGFVTGRLAVAVASAGWSVAVVGADGWLELPERRFDARRPAEHFYARGLRLDDMFADVLLPLRDARSCDVVADFAEETASSFRARRHRYDDVDVVLVEGIFLFKRHYRPHFDLACWVECTFETALERAVRRAQEGLPPAQTIAAYETIYFPAQRIHLERDDPRSSADLRIENDPRLRLAVAR
jgi:uridine kinase